MLKYIVNRLLWLPVLLVIISFITFALGVYGPGDPVQQLLGQRSDPETVARIRRELGLDRPLVIQYIDYVRRALRGDLGESITVARGQPVIKLIARGLWVSIQLNAVVIALGVVVGIPLGVLAAVRRNTLLDYLTTAGVVMGISFPTFLTAPILLWLLSYQVRLLPPGGWDGVFSRSVILPALVLGAGPIAVFARQTRANLIEVLDQDYVRTARAKGLPELLVLGRHALRNALIPLITIFGLMLGGLVTGSFITETIFGIPGIGRLGFRAFSARDYPILTALTLLIAVSYTLANLLVDVVYALADPRIRYE
ncbi:MAG: ABC transporter permease [Ardenticatenia bacterium]|nr:ABC transporter permease [Ardenticatenia bacterium]